MKASELMVGDLLTFKDCVHDEVFPVLKVDGIMPDILFVRIDDSEADDEVGYDELVGIPLTPEILEKNGFRWDGSGQRSMMLMTDCNVPGIRWNIYVGLKHRTIEAFAAHPEERTPNWRKHNKVYLEVCRCCVHELQHALRLCGINLEIKL